MARQFSLMLACYPRFPFEQSYGNFGALFGRRRKVIADAALSIFSNSYRPGVLD